MFYVMFNYIQLYSIVFIYMSIIFVALYNLYSFVSNMFCYVQLYSIAFIYMSIIFVALYTLYSPLPPLADDVRTMQEAYAGNHDTSTTTTITEPAPPPPPPRADDAYAMWDAYAGDNAKAGRVCYLDANLKTMKVAYTRRWVADNAEPSATQPSTSTNHTATSKWTWSTTSSEMSASSCRHSGLISTIASQVRVILAGRIVNRQEVMFQVMRELSDIFYKARIQGLNRWRSIGTGETTGDPVRGRMTM